MASIRLMLQVQFANGQNAALLDVRASEPGHSYDLGKTGADGRISRTVRPRRSNFGIDDPTDNPVLQVTFSDLDGRSTTAAVPTFATPPLLVLPAALNPRPDEAPTVPAGTAGSPSARADQALQPLVPPNAPGHVFLVRRDGVPWANATRGLARVAAPGASGRAMTNDTVLHLSSMSKPVTATALVAMLEDWAEMRDEVAAIGTPGAPTVPLTVSIPGRPQTGRRNFNAPSVLAPLFADRTRARSFVDGAWPPQVSADFRATLNYFAHGGLVAPQPAVPPGYFGLLRRVLDRVTVPTFNSLLLPLIRDRLGAGRTIGAGVAGIRIRDLLRHETNIASFSIASTAVQPAGGVAQVDYWAELRQLLALPCNRTPATRSYNNHNYTALTAVIDVCTEVRFDDYLNQRLFLDPRFGRIRRHVVDPALGALYYKGTVPNWTGGVPYPDYGNWPGNGGLFASANQFTDWMHALYTRQPVAQMLGPKPLVSATGITRLFGPARYFAGGLVSAPPGAAQASHEHNGGTNVGGAAGGDVNGKLAVVIGPSGSVYTALYVANSNFPADNGPLGGAFGIAMNALVWT